MKKLCILLAGTLAIINITASAWATTVTFSGNAETYGTYISSFETRVNHGNDQSYIVGTYMALRRTLIAFPYIFGNLTGQIPYGAAISSATLYLTTTPTGSSVVSNSVHNILVLWSEAGVGGVTWQTFSTGGLVAGRDYEITAVDNFTPAQNSTTYNINVTSSIQDFSSQIKQNYGWFIAAPYDNSNDASAFYSDDVTNSPLLIPRITITYTNPIIPDPTAVPEPMTICLFGIALCFGWRNISGRKMRR